MKTDAKTMAEIWREIENNPDAEIEYFSSCAKWYKKSNHIFDPYSEWYRIKPKTIILSNGVEIPKPLTKEQIGRIPCDIMVYGVWSLGNFYIEENPLDCVHYMNDKSIIYKTKEEAIEASKALFGIE